MGDLSFPAILTGLGSDSGADRLSSPLPKDPADALLTEMLVPAPYEAPEKKAKKKAAGTRKGLRRKVVSDSSSDNTEAPSSHENEEEEEESSPPQPGETRKGRSKGPRRAGPSLRTTPRQPPTSATSVYPGSSPWRSRKYPNTIVIHGMFYCTASPHAEHDYAVRPEPVSTYLRRTVLWTRRI